MSSRPQRCAKCNSVLPTDSWTCPSCGADTPEPVAVKADSPRSPLWKYFWILFLATPFLTVGVVIPTPITRMLLSWLGLSPDSVQPLAALALLGSGTVSSAVILARIYTGTIQSVSERRTRSGFLTVKSRGKAGLLLLIYALMFGFGISIVYAGVAFVGCAVLAGLGGH